ncbi:MAG TPA: hypothetical protein VFZ70_05865 [Euzebyales bacterium]
MCTAVRIVILAATKERRAALRRAAVGTAWQVVAAVGDVDEAVDRLRALHAKVLVVDAASGASTDHVRTPVGDVLLVGVGDLAGADAVVPAEDLGRLPGALADLLHAGGDHTH